MSIRKPYNDRHGYRASRRSGKKRGWVVIYEAKEQGIDTNGARYAVVCETHGAIVAEASLPQARKSMQDPSQFCDGCRDGGRADQARP